MTLKPTPKETLSPSATPAPTPSLVNTPGLVNTPIAESMNQGTKKAIDLNAGGTTTNEKQELDRLVLGFKVGLETISKILVDQSNDIAKALTKFVESFKEGAEKGVDLKEKYKEEGEAGGQVSEGTKNKVEEVNKDLQDALNKLTEALTKFDLEKKFDAQIDKIVENFSAAIVRVLNSGSKKEEEEATPKEEKKPTGDLEIDGPKIDEGPDLSTHFNAAKPVDPNKAIMPELVSAEEQAKRESEVPMDMTDTWNQEQEITDKDIVEEEPKKKRSKQKIEWSKVLGAMLGLSKRGNDPFTNTKKVLHRLRRGIWPKEDQKKIDEHRRTSEGGSEEIDKKATGGQIREGEAVIVGDKEGQKTGAEEVVINKGGKVEVISNKEAEQEGLLEGISGIVRKATGGMSIGQMAAQGGEKGSPSQAGHDIAGGLSGGLQGIVESFSATLGPVGQILGAALNENINVFERLAHVVINLVKGFNELSEKIARFSGEITEAIVKSKVREMETDMKIADEAGPDLARIYEQSNNIWQDIREILVSLAEPIINILVPFLDIAKAVFEVLKPVLKVLGLILSIPAMLFRALTGDVQGAADSINRQLQGITNAIQQNAPERTLSGRFLSEAAGGYTSAPSFTGV